MNTTSHTTRLAGLIVAVFMTAGLNGVMLWGFDQAVQDGAQVVQIMSQAQDSGTRA